MIELNKHQQKDLLALARNTIADHLGIEHQSHAADFNDDIFNEKCGAFVTIHIKGNLRGCIGYITGVKNIPETITEMAKASAFNDPRFPALKKEEFRNIDIEISVLSPIEEVNNVSDIIVGRDGLIITKGYNSGLLLPQVPVEQGWDLKTYLAHTCFKAGLPPNAWEDKSAKIEKFSAQVFSEIDTETQSSS